MWDNQKQEPTQGRWGELSYMYLTYESYFSICPFSCLHCSLLSLRIPESPLSKLDLEHMRPEGLRRKPWQYPDTGGGGGEEDMRGVPSSKQHQWESWDILGKHWFIKIAHYMSY